MFDILRAWTPFHTKKGDYALHSTVEEGDTVLLSAEAIFEAEMLTLTGRKDGGRPFMLRTQLHILGIIHPETRPHTPGTHRLGSWHSELFSAELLAPPLTLLSRVRTKGDPFYFCFNCETQGISDPCPAEPILQGLATENE